MFKTPPEINISSDDSKAIEKIMSRDVTNLVSEQILMISDSLSAVIALKNLYSKYEIILVIRKFLSHSNKEIEFSWVPSHIGIAGNERGDLRSNYFLLAR
jgi:ribonuclease HI